MSTEKKVTVEDLINFLKDLPKDAEVYQQLDPMDLSNIGFNKETNILNLRGRYLQGHHNLIGFVCAGSHSRSSSLVMDKEQRIFFDLAMDELKKNFDSILPKWKTIEISIM